jgi:hypothetical protein
MHVLHRPHLPRAIGATITAAILAIAITLAVATGLSGGGGAAGAPERFAAVASSVSQATAVWTRSPFALPLSRPVQLPWSAATEATATRR